MKYLYAPWRSNYVTRSPAKGDCVFCEHSTTTDDSKHFIITRLQHCFISLNLFPYNPGHVMVIPYRHVANLTKLTAQERCELMEAATTALTVLQQTLHADGFNVGVNLGGKAAGGSIPHHLHMHVLPRWHGDTSFLTTLAETKQIAADLNQLYKTLTAAFNTKTPSGETQKRKARKKPD